MCGLASNILHTPYTRAEQAGAVAEWVGECSSRTEGGRCAASLEIEVNVCSAGVRSLLPFLNGLSSFQPPHIWMIIFIMDGQTSELVQGYVGAKNLVSPKNKLISNFEK